MKKRCFIIYFRNKCSKHSLEIRNKEATSKSAVVLSLEIFKRGDTEKGFSEKESRVFQNVRQNFRIINHKLVIDGGMNIMGYIIFLVEFSGMEENRE